MAVGWEGPAPWSWRDVNHYEIRNSTCPSCALLDTFLKMLTAANNSDKCVLVLIQHSA